MKRQNDPKSFDADVVDFNQNAYSKGWEDDEDGRRFVTKEETVESGSTEAGNSCEDQWGPVWTSVVQCVEEALLFDLGKGAQNKCKMPNLYFGVKNGLKMAKKHIEILYFS